MTVISSKVLADRMEILERFTPDQLVRDLRLSTGKQSNKASMRCRLARLSNKVDPITGEHAITKLHNGRAVYYKCSKLQADRIRDEAALLNINKMKSSVITTKYGGSKGGVSWEGCTLSGKPGTKALMIGV